MRRLPGRTKKIVCLCVCEITKNPLCVHQQMFLHASAGSSTNFEICPGQHAVLESQHWKGNRAKMIGRRLFTVNKNKGWQAGWLLRRNAPGSHLHSLFVSLATSNTNAALQCHILTYVWIMYPVPTRHGWPWRHVCIFRIYPECCFLKVRFLSLTLNPRVILRLPNYQQHIAFW